MAKIDDKYKNLIKPDTFWSPYRYYALAAYVFMFNAIKENPLDYGISSTNLDKSINDYIKTHFDELNKKFGFNFKSVKDADFLKEPGSYKQGSFKLPCIKEDFLKDFDSLVGEAWTISRALEPKGKMMSNADMQNILYAKEDDAKSFYENIRNNSKFKQGNIDPKEGKDKSGRHAVEWETAQIEDEEKLKNIRRNGRKTFLHAILTGLAAVGTIASAGTLLSFGGLALGSLFGTAVSSAGLGAAALGLGGTIAGGWLTKTFFGKFIEKWSKGRVLRQDRRDFHSGLGKYVTKDGKAKGFRSIRDTLKRDLAFKAYMDECGKHPEYLLGYGKDKDGNWIKKLTPEEFMYKFVKKKYHKYLTGKYIRGEGFGLNKLVEAGLHTAFVNQNAGKNYGFSNIYSRAATVVNEYNIYEKSVPEIVSVYNNFFESDTPEAVKQRADIDSVVGKLGDLKTLQKKFDEAGDVGHAQYNELLDKFSHQIDNSFTDTLFNTSFNNSKLVRVSKLLENKDIKDILDTDGPSDVSSSSINSMVKFLQTEQKSDAISGDIGVNVVNQIHNTKKNIVDGCKSLVGDASNIDMLSIEGLAGRIENVSSRSDISAIGSDIDKLSDDKVKTYLHFMLGQKEKNTTLNSADIVSKIGSSDPKPSSVIEQISKLDNSENATTIKDEIMGSTTFTSEEKTKLYNVLNEQTGILETKNRTQARESVLDKIINKANPKLDEYLKSISEFKDIDTEKMYDVHYSLSKVNPIEVRTYLLYKFKDRVTKNFEETIKANKRFNISGGDYSKAIEDILDYLKTLTAATKKGYIDKWQQEKCIDLIGGKIETVFNQYLKNIEEEFLQDNAGKMKAVNYYLDNKIDDGGLLDFLDKNTPNSNAIKARMQRIVDARNLKLLLTASTKVIGDIEDEGSDDAKKTTRIYLKKERNTDDLLVKCLNNLQEIARNTNNGSVDPERITATGNNESKILNSTETIDNINLNESFVHLLKTEIRSGAYSQIADPEDKIAALLVMKKRVAAMLKLQMFKMHDRERSTYPYMTDFVTKYGSTLTEGIISKWSELAKIIDNEIDTVSNDKMVRNEFKSVPSVQTMIENGCNISSYNTYANSKQM